MTYIHATRTHKTYAHMTRGRAGRSADIATTIQPRPPARERRSTTEGPQ
jgi:hypothetical protein